MPAKESPTLVLREKKNLAPLCLVVARLPWVGECQEKRHQEMLLLHAE